MVAEPGLFGAVKAAVDLGRPWLPRGVNPAAAGAGGFFDAAEAVVGGEVGEDVDLCAVEEPVGFANTRSRTHGGILLRRTTRTQLHGKLAEGMGQAVENGGLIRREPDPTDRCAHLLVLTEQGRLTAAELRARLAANPMGSLSSWPPGEAEISARHLRRFALDGPFA